MDINTAKLIGAVNANIPKTKAIEELLERGIGEGYQLGPGVNPTSTSPSWGKSVEVDGFIFKPGVCRRKGSNVICTVSFMNNGSEDREIKILAKSEHSGLIDNFGNKYEVIVKIADRQSGGPGVFHYDISEKFTPKLFVNVEFIAEDVKPEATHYIAIISIEGFKKLVAVRNIPVIK